MAIDFNTAVSHFGKGIGHLSQGDGTGTLNDLLIGTGMALGARSWTRGITENDGVGCPGLGTTSQVRAQDSLSRRTI